MPRSRSGGRSARGASRAARARPAPDPQPVNHAPPPPPPREKRPAGLLRTMAKGMALGAGFGVAHRIFGPRPTPTAPTEEPTRKHCTSCTVPPASAAPRPTPTPTPLCYAPTPRTAPAPPPPSTPFQPVRPLLRLQPRARGGACIAHHKALIDCLNTYQSDISKCQLYVDILVACKSSNSGAEAKLRVHEV